MLDKIKLAKRMYRAGNTHGEILEVTGLPREVEYAATLPEDYSVDHIYTMLPLLKPGLKAVEIENILKS